MKNCLNKSNPEVAKMAKDFGDVKTAELLDKHYPTTIPTYDEFIKNANVKEELGIIPISKIKDEIGVSFSKELSDSQLINLKSLVSRINNNSKKYIYLLFNISRIGQADLYKWGLRKVEGELDVQAKLDRAINRAKNTLETNNKIAELKKKLPPTQGTLFQKFEEIPPKEVIIPTDALKTFDFGKKEGTSQTKQTDQIIHNNVINNPNQPMFEEGESFNEAFERVIPEVRKILEETPANTVLVTHNSIFGLIKLWNDLGRPESFTKEERIKYTEQDGDFPTGTVIRIQGTNGDVYVVRHGETNDNLNGKYRRSNADLTEKGIEQAKEVGKELKEVEISRIISSSLPRTIHTSELIAKENDRLKQYDSFVEGLEWINKIFPEFSYELKVGLIKDIARGSFDTMSDLIMFSIDYANKSTVKHEAGHLFFKYLPEKRKQALLAEGSKVFNIPLENRRDIEEKIMEVLEKSPDNYPKTTILGRFFDEVIQFLKNIFNKRTEIQDFVYDVNKGNLVKYVKNYVEENNVPKEEAEVLYQLAKSEEEIKAQEKQITEDLNKELDTKKSKELIGLVEEVYDLISRQLKKQLNNPSYERLNKIFTNEKGVSKYTTLKDSLQRIMQLSQGVEEDAKRANILTKSMIQINYLLDLMSEDIFDKGGILDADENAPLENLKTLQTYLNTLSDWREFTNEVAIKLDFIPSIRSLLVEIKGKIDTIEQRIARNDESVIVKSLKEILIPASVEFTKVYEEKISQLEKNNERYIKEGKTDKVKFNEAEIKRYKKVIEDFNFEENQNIIDFLTGKRGDVSAFNNMAEAFLDSSDPVVYAFTTFVRQQMDRVHQQVFAQSKQMDAELAPLVKASERLSPKSLNEKVSFIDKILDYDGKLKQVLTLLNPWKNYRYDYSSLKFKEQEAKEKWKQDYSDEAKKEYDDARKARLKFEQNVMYQEYSSKFYEKYKLYDDEVGRDLKEDIDSIFGEIDAIKEAHNYRDEELTDDDLEKINDLLLKYKLLANIYNADGTLKVDTPEDKALSKALRMQKIREINREVYTWKDNYVLFEKAKERIKEHLLKLFEDEESEGYKEGFKRWEADNTRTVVTEQFYKDVKNTITEIQLLLKRTKNEDLNESISELSKNTYELMKGYRDEDNQPIGSLINETKAEKIKEYQERIEQLKQKVKEIGGLTSAQYERLQELEEKSENDELDPNEEVELQELQDLQNNTGLSDIAYKRLNKLFQDLSEMQAKLPTDYYVEAFNDIAGKYGITINLSGLINGTNDDILESPELDKLLENSDFKEWFELNHYKGKVWNNTLFAYEDKWKRCPQWSITKPLNEKYYEVRPSLKYSKREVKDEYKTGYNPETKKVELVVGEHIDNKGDFLPDPNKEGSNIYKNEKYYDLVDKNDSESKRLTKVLNIYKKYLLLAQDGKANSIKLYLDLPSVLREEREKNFDTLKNYLLSPSKLTGEAGRRIKETWLSMTSYDYDSDNYTVKEPRFGGRYIKNFINIPMKFTYTLPVDIITYNFALSIPKYHEAAEINKVSVENIPISKAITRVLEPISEEKGGKRKAAIRRVLGAEFEGKRSNIELTHLPASVRKSAVFINSLIRKMAIWATIKLSLPSSFANILEAKTSNWQKALANRAYSPKDLLKAEGQSWEYIYSWIKDWYQNDLTKKSMHTKLEELFEPIQGNPLSEKLGKNFASSPTLDIITFKPILEFRGFGEEYVQTNQWLAIMNATKIVRTHNGITENITLADAYEHDGTWLKLKEGVPESWNPVDGKDFLRTKALIQQVIRETHGNNSVKDKSMMDAYLMGSNYLFLKKFFISKFVDAFSGKLTKKANGWVTVEPRFHGQKGAHIGYVSSSVKSLFDLIENRFKNYDNLTTLEKDNLAQLIGKIVSIMGPALLINYVFGYGGDDKNKNKKIRGRSSAEILTLYLLDRLYVDQLGLFNPATYVNYIFSFTLGNALTKWGLLIKYLITGEEYKYTAKTSKGKILHKAREKKWISQFKRVTGIYSNQMLFENPDYMLQIYDKSFGN